MPLLRIHSPTKLWDGAQMANFWRFFASCISASRVQHVSDLHSKFTLRPLDIQSAEAEIRRGKQDRKKEEEETRG